MRVWLFVKLFFVRLLFEVHSLYGEIFFFFHIIPLFVKTLAYLLQ